MTRKKLRYILAAGLLLLFAATAGCDQQIQPDGDSSGGKSKTVETVDNTKAEQPERQGEALKVYFSNRDATKLIAKEKKQDKARENKYEAAVELLIEGSGDSDAVSVIPPKTKLRGVKIANGVAYVDFSGEFVKNFNGGSAGEIMLVGSIVNTLTEFKEIKAVQLLVEGEKIETISGHMDTSEPFARFKDLSDE